MGGGIIGSGVFGLPTVMGSAAGPAFVLAIVFVGLVARVLARIHAEIGFAFPLTGGPHSIPRLAVGDSAGFLTGWGSIPAGEVKNASKNIPRTMLVTGTIAVALCTLIRFAFTGPINWSGLGLSPGDWASIGGLSSPLSDVSKAAGYGLLAATVTAGTVASTAGAGGGWVRSQGGVPYAMAEGRFSL